MFLIFVFLSGICNGKSCQALSTVIYCGCLAGMAWLVVVAVLATVISLAHGDAGHFFAETPKHLPRIGRRGDLPPLVSDFYHSPLYPKLDKAVCFYHLLMNKT